MITLSRRERQILDILYARGRAAAADILGSLPDPPSYSATRALLKVVCSRKGMCATKKTGRAMCSSRGCRGSGRV